MLDRKTYLLWLSPCGCSWVLAVELDDERLGYVQRIRGANDPRKLRYVENHRDAVRLRVYIERLSDVFQNRTEDFLLALVKGCLRVLTLALQVLFHRIDLVSLLRGEFRILN